MKFAKNVRTAVALIGFGLCTSAMAENPIIQTYYSPDPAPVVFGDTVCVYTGNDEGGNLYNEVSLQDNSGAIIVFPSGR